ncbi:hypothetical protein HYT45_03510 [Candidatus Uhrbacteria bacterium]|nr:hypothetical protein [Candidatus Uhrbacteria bacterium]
MTDKDKKEHLRIGLMSRIDYGSDGFRQGLIDLAAEVFRKEDVHFVILAGGLVSGRAVARKLKNLSRDFRLLEKPQKKLLKELGKTKDEIKKLEMKKGRTLSEQRELARLVARLSEIEKELDAVDPQLRILARKIRDLSPEVMAKRLARHLPHFKNVKGETVKFYVVLSEAYDKAVGIETGMLLSRLRSQNEMRLYEDNAVNLPLWSGKPHARKLEVLTPVKAVWMRGDYYSTPVERMIKDRSKQSASSAPDLRIAGCFGSSITKPKGEAKVPYVAVPVLSRIEETTVNENQIGVQVVEVYHDRAVPVVRNYPFKDLISRERAFIGLPAEMSPRRRKCIESLKEHGKRTTGLISDDTGLSRECVKETLQKLQARKGKLRKRWPGVVYDELSDRWDFALEWVMKKLSYFLPTGERKVDRMVGVCCTHFGSLDTDYQYLASEVPVVMLEHNADILVNAGDSVEGLKHNMMQRGELYAGMNLTQQERGSGLMFASIILKVFRARFAKSLDGLDAKKLPKEKVAELILAALVTYIYILGNHDLWDTDSGHQPLATKIDTMILKITEEIEKILAEKGLNKVDNLISLVRSKIVTNSDGRFTLPSGLRMAVMHPHMARAKTTSLRPQEMLDKADDCQVVVGGNFHVGEELEVWESALGQRLCVEIGTAKHGSPFEDNKLKTVDQGFARLRVESVGGRVVGSETTFYSNENVKQRKLNPEKPFLDFLKEIGLDG